MKAVAHTRWFAALGRRRFIATAAIAACAVGVSAHGAAPRSHPPPHPRYAIKVIPVEVGPAWPGYLPQVGPAPLRTAEERPAPPRDSALPPIAAALVHLTRGQPVPVARDFDPAPPPEIPDEPQPAEPPAPPPPPPPPKPEDFLPYFEVDPLANPRRRRPRPDDGYHFVPALADPTALPRSEATYELR